MLRSVGYKGVPLRGVPFDARHGVIPNEVGRVVDLDTGKVITGEYVAGWIKRGPTGVIGTNKPDAIESVNSMFEDLDQGKIQAAPAPDPAAIPALLRERGVRFVTQDEWKRIDAKEVADGVARDKPRVKIVEPGGHAGGAGVAGVAVDVDKQWMGWSVHSIHYHYASFNIAKTLSTHRSVGPFPVQSGSRHESVHLPAGRRTPGTCRRRRVLARR